MMNLCRMTTWTDLSDVQMEEEDLFDQAFQQIEKAMAKGKRPGRRTKNG
jgi:hypothetical protein